MIATGENNSANFKTSWKPLKNILVATFSSWKILNASFYSVYIYEYLSQIRSFYDILSTLPNYHIRAVLKANNILLKRIGRPLRKLSDILILLILENPFLFQHIYKNESNNIIKRTFGYISSMSNEIRHYIINWFCNYDPNILYKKIQLCNSFISKILYKYTQRWIVKVIMTLIGELKFTSNNQKTTFLSEFYNAMLDNLKTFCTGLVEEFQHLLTFEEYVKRYTSFILNTSISKQFGPLKREFYHVFRGNTLSLFRQEEIELLIRGSPESLHVDQLCAVAVYDSSNSLQTRLLAFVTRSDHIPATGAANLLFKIFILADDCNRYPIAHTCKFI
ncbi:hypothetical protein T552_00302 [Pneumocystis carinii B80]|uniref:HECT-type E3 ubiquitin transferase n=1 Tax=Pneumocystis carinii (strain B80) TaxID=1408658 RepID=A0A0W4ZQC9_PNEC8|nr:hypothetical protein T552_00302 [Pneumocystis carinii B80]KTW30585.1 hypothetical protein T552_00302 [Pneumocystis carinii B80]